LHGGAESGILIFTDIRFRFDVRLQPSKIFGSLRSIPQIVSAGYGIGHIVRQAADGQCETGKRQQSLRQGEPQRVALISSIGSSNPVH
jgi:hypothetical protein